MMLREEVLQTGALAIFAQNVLLAKHFSDAADDGENLVPANVSVEADGEMRVGGKSAADADRKTGLLLAMMLALDGGEADVVDFGVRAPDGATGDGHFEFAREIVESVVAREQARGF